MKNEETIKETDTEREKFMRERERDMRPPKFDLFFISLRKHFTIKVKKKLDRKVDSNCNPISAKQGPASRFVVKVNCKPL